MADAKKPKPPTNVLVYFCQRCRAHHTERHAEPEIELRRMVEAGQLHTFHACPDGTGTGYCRIVGTGTAAA